jgi:hypothetical protein
MECPNCHHWNEAGARFCEECGFELTAANAVPAKVSITGGIDPAPVSDAPPVLFGAASNAAANPDNVPAPPPQVIVPATNSAPPPTAPYSGARLVLESTGSIFKLGDATLIGREDPTLQIDFDGYTDGQYISHRHAQIVKHDSAFFLEDLGSSNHTRVNGAKLSVGQAQLLKDGDKVRFGKIELTFHES